MKKALAFSFLVVFSVGGFAQGYNVIGDSYELGEDCYVLTPPLLNQSGAIWYNESIDLNEPFKLSFIANFDDFPNGADGMVFVLQQVSSTVLGADGEGMGFSGFAPSFGVEFDIFQNQNLGDPPYDHIAILRDGNVNHNSPNNLFGPVQASATNPSIKDGEDHVIEIEWDPEIQLFSVAFDCDGRAAINIDLISEVFNNEPVVFWGFTGATGGQVAQIEVCLDPFILGVPGDVSTCPGQPVQLQATGAASGTYAWSPPEFLDDPTLQNPTAVVDVPTVFTVTYTDLCGNAEEATIQVLIDSLDIDLGPDRLICEGAVATFILPEGPNYLWSTGEVGPEFSAGLPGLYWVDAELDGCVGSDTVAVVVTPGFDEVAIESAPATCGAEDGSFEVVSVTGSEGPFLYSLDGAEQSGPFFGNLAQGTYVLEVTDPSGCLYTTVVEIGFVNFTEAGFEASPLSGTAPLEVSIEDLSSNADNVVYIAGGQTYPGNIEAIVLEEMGTYEIMQLAWSHSLACADTAFITIVVDANVHLDAPNIITPNNDGRNDHFVISTLGVARVSLEVFNRWGTLLLEVVDFPVSDGETTLWVPDDHPDGVYFYLLRFTDLNGMGRVVEGPLTLSRASVR